MIDALIPLADVHVQNITNATVVLLRTKKGWFLKNNCVCYILNMQVRYCYWCINHDSAQIGHHLIKSTFMHMQTRYCYWCINHNWDQIYHHITCKHFWSKGPANLSSKFKFDFELWVLLSKVLANLSSIMIDTSIEIADLHVENITNL